MGLESATYINGLTASWPPSGDPKSQGDDHLRLIKSVLQATFPGASGPLYFPKGEATTGTLTLDVTDQSNVISVTTTSGDVSVVLPAGFTTANAGWSCEVVKVTSDTNAAVVTPASGTINSKVGPTSSIRVGALFEPARFLWTGSLWICSKPGPMIGATINWDGAVVPYGCLVLDGSTFSSTTFAELFAAYGSTTLKDKRGRVEAGVDSGGLRLTSGTNGFAVAATLGAVGGNESNTLDATRVPILSFSGTTGNDSPDHTHSYSLAQTSGTQKSTGAGTAPFDGLTGSSTGGASTRHQHPFSGSTSNAGGGAHQNVQPTIVTQKIVRAC